MEFFNVTIVPFARLDGATNPQMLNGGGGGVLLSTGDKRTTPIVTTPEMAVLPPAVNSFARKLVASTLPGNPKKPEVLAEEYATC